MSGTLLSKIHAVRLQGLTVVKMGKTNLGLFAAYADVWSTLQPALAGQGLSVGFSAARIVLHGDVEMVTMDMEISDGESSVTWPFDMVIPERIMTGSGKSVTNNAQRVASGQSYLRRTALIHAFGMSAGNEDEVEKMVPVGDQTNTPGTIFVDERTTWQGLMDGMWADVMSPLHDGKLSFHASQGNVHMAGMWTDHPNHPGIMAWAADWINGGLETAGLSWADVMEMDPALPSALTACNAGELRAAAKAAKQLLKERSAA
jgi:hypothetical protein